jgi:hypothetical protein
MGLGHRTPQEARCAVRLLHRRQRSAPLAITHDELDVHATSDGLIVVSPKSGHWPCDGEHLAMKPLQAGALRYALRCAILGEAPTDPT